MPYKSFVRHLQTSYRELRMKVLISEEPGAPFVVTRLLTTFRLCVPSSHNAAEPRTRL